MVEPIKLNKAIIEETTREYIANCIKLDGTLGFYEYLERGSVTLLQAKTGVGKSYTMLALAYYFTDLKLKVAYISLENSMGLDFARAEKYMLPAYGDMHFDYYNDNTADFEEYAEAFRKNSYDVVLLDGLQYSVPLAGDSSRDVQYHEAFKAWRELFRELNIASFVSWQSNRSDTSGNESISGSYLVAQDADGIITVTVADGCETRLLKLTKARMYMSHPEYVAAYNLGDRITSHAERGRKPAAGKCSLEYPGGR